MTPLAFWQLMLALIGVIVVLRILGWWAWRLLAGTAVGLWMRGRESRGLRAAGDRVGQRFPRLTGFLRRRIAVERFSGLPLTLMVLLAAYVLTLAAGLLEDLFEGRELDRLDRTINQNLDILRDERFVELFGWITALGNTETLAAVVLVTIGFLWAHKRYAYIPGLLLTIVGSQALTWVGKFAIDRERPEFLTFASAWSPSFPSGHAAGAAAVYGFVAYAIARDLTGERQRFELGFWAVIAIALIAFSRAVLSVHFASDIAAGLLVGAFWLLAGFALTEYLRERHFQPRRNPPWL